MEPLQQLAAQLVEQTAITTSVVRENASSAAMPIVQWSNSAKAAVAKVFSSQIKVLARDLEAFAAHAKRSTISVEDVKLALRKNPELALKVGQFKGNEIGTSKKTKVSNGNNNEIKD